MKVLVNPILAATAVVAFACVANAEWRIEETPKPVPDYEIPYLPTPNPPDDSVPIGHIRYSTLPIESIMDAVDDNTTNLNIFSTFKSFDTGDYHLIIHNG